MSTESKTIPADPAKRRQAMLAVLVMLAVGIVGFLLLRQQIQQINLALDAGDNAEAIWLSRRMGIVILACLLCSGLGLAAITEKLARLCKQQGRYPPQGMNLLRSTQLRTGPAVDRIVLGLRVGTGLLVLLTGGLVAWSGLLLYHLY